MGIANRLSDFLFGDDEENVPSSEKVTLPGTGQVERIKIIVDHREDAGGFANELERLGDRFEVSRAMLDIGDVSINGRIGVERKRADDFVESMKDGRLFHQAGGLAEAYAERAIIVEGGFTAEAVGGMSADAIRGAMVSLQFDWGIHLLRSRDVKESADYIAILGNRLSKRRGSRRSMPPSGVPKLSAESLEDGNTVEAVVVALPGVGRARAQMIAAKYPDFPSLMRATPRDLGSIEGVGPVLATRIHALLHGGGSRG